MYVQNDFIYKMFKYVQNKMMHSGNTHIYVVKLKKNTWNSK